MLSREENAKSAVIRTYRSRVRYAEILRVRFGMVVLVCSLVSSAAFGQPPSNDVSSPNGQNSAPSASVEGAVETDVSSSVEPALREAIEALQEKTTMLRDDVGEMRALPNPSAVPILPRNKAQLSEYIRATMQKYAGAQIKSEARILRMFGVVESEAAYFDLVLSLLTEEVAGYYEPDEKSLYVLEDNLGALDDMIIAHELQHAAQDHHWDLQKILRPSWWQSDVLSARSMLTEGDATLLMFAYSMGGSLPRFAGVMVNRMVKHMRKESERLAKKYPRVMADAVISPYAEGLSFAYALYAHGGWDAVNAAFDTLPLSTAQVLYPERYLNGEEPTLLSFDVPEDAFVRRHVSDVWGLAGMRHLFADLAPNMPKAVIDASTSGWKGDRMELWESNTQEVLIWVSVFDSAQSSKAFYGVLKQLAPSLLSKADLTCALEGHGQHCGAVHDGRGVLVEQWGDLALLILAENTDATDADVSAALLLRTAQEVLQTVRRATYPDEWR